MNREQWLRYPILIHSGRPHDAALIGRAAEPPADKPERHQGEAERVENSGFPGVVMSFRLIGVDIHAAIP
jgi:hypothetical protein